MTAFILGDNDLADGLVASVSFRLHFPQDLDHGDSFDFSLYMSEMIVPRFSAKPPAQPVGPVISSKV